MATSDIYPVEEILKGKIIAEGNDTYQANLYSCSIEKFDSRVSILKSSFKEQGLEPTGKDYLFCIQILTKDRVNCRLLPYSLLETRIIEPTKS